MTENESRIEAARKREEAAVLALSRAYRETAEAMMLVRKRYVEIETLAEKELRYARQDLTRLELRAHGIQPLYTIFRWGTNYCVAKITVSGRAEVFRVTDKNAISRRWPALSGTPNWKDVIVTKRVLGGGMV